MHKVSSGVVVCNVVVMVEEITVEAEFSAVDVVVILDGVVMVEGVIVETVPMFVVVGVVPVVEVVTVVVECVDAGFVVVCFLSDI